jgi:hypothetical protein
MVDTEISKIALGFLSGIGVSLFSAVAAYYLNRRKEKQQTLESAELEAYFKLLDIYNQYFWVTVAETHKEKVDPILIRPLNESSWKLADHLRKNDKVAYLDEILDVVFNEAYSTAVDRHRKMDELISKLGKRVNPRYAKVIHSISSGNVMHLASGAKRNAPASQTIEV